jgi:transposase
LLTQGWTQEHIAQALDRDAHTIGHWIEALRQRGPVGLQSDGHGAPPALTADEQGPLTETVRAAPASAGIAVVRWSWKSVHQFVEQRLGKVLSPRHCVRYLRRLGFAWQRPKRRFVKANADKRAAFVAQYRTLVDEASQSGARSFFADEAHFRADGDLRGMWVPRGENALVDSTSPRYGEQASYYAAVCLETGAVGGARVEGTTTAVTSVAFCRGCGQTAAAR